MAETLITLPLLQTHRRIAQENPGATHVHIRCGHLGLPHCVAQSLWLISKQQLVQTSVHLPVPPDR